MDLVAIVGTLVVGFGAGMLSGMFGVGGAVISTPAIRALGATPIEAVGSTIPAILPAAISGALRYAKEGLVDWRIAGTCGIAGTVMAIVGAKVSDLVDARWLMVATAVLVLWSGVGSIRKGLAMEGDHDVVLDEEDGERSADVPALAGVGAVAGFLAGLLGIGGGAIMMPLFTSVLRLPVKVAVASSLVAVAIFSIPAMVSHAWLGHINWAFALLLVAGTVPGARVGSKIAIATADRRMRILLGVFFCIIAFVYGGRELVDILTA
ncbi:MAG: sulfite exporter TauE/SafE family protein [Acidimicrobiales bacterium]|nr:sulfite exporter TauE/SafE family protein [Acidimicrobiales bacterium]